MNKKFLFGSLAIAGMLFATSCTNDDLIDNPTGNEATVQFNLKTSDALTRAISDGTSANQLVYQVFRVENGSYKQVSEIIKIDNFVSGQNVSLQLAKGHEYAVAFWAQNSDAPYSFYTNETEGLGVNMNYGDNNKNGNNAEYRDAFFGSETFTVTGNNAKEVTLYRPFAQVNVGASDYSVITEAGLNVTKSSAHFSNVATKLNLISGTVDGSEEIIYTLDAGALYNPNPDQTLTVEGNDYKWLSMCYVLPNSDPATATLVATNFTFQTGQGTITLSEGLDNTPIRRNYRTNIIGKVLSSDVDFRVNIDADFQTPDYNVTIWDGESIAPAIDETGAYVIKNASNWVWLTERDTYGKNIKLDADLNFGGKAVKSLVLTGNTSTIDGQGHTISNVVLTYDNTDSFYSIGLMVPSFLSKGVTLTVKDLTVTDVTIDSNGALYSEEGGNIEGFAGVIFGDVQSVNQQVNLTNVHVKNAKVKGTQSVAGLVGLVADGSTLNLTNCSVEDSEITNYKTENESGYVCGLVGKVVGTLNINSNVAVKNTNITGFYAPVRGSRSIDAVAVTYEKNGTSSGTINGKDDVTVTETTVTALTFNDIVVETAADLQAIAAGFNAGDSYEGKTICIMADIDLADINWSLAQINNRYFGGTIEGNGHTIRNMRVVVDTSQDGSAGFIGWLNGTIRNLNFENANVEGSHYVGVICGYNQYGTIENCTVNRSKVNAMFINGDKDGDKCGGAIGFCGTNAQVTVKNVKVTNTAVTARRNAAQVIGYCYPDGTTIENLKAENVTVEWNNNTFDDGNDGVNITEGLYNRN